MTLASVGAVFLQTAASHLLLSLDMFGEDDITASLAYDRPERSVPKAPLAAVPAWSGYPGMISTAVVLSLCTDAGCHSKLSSAFWTLYGGFCAGYFACSL